MPRHAASGYRALWCADTKTGSEEIVVVLEAVIDPIFVVVNLRFCRVQIDIRFASGTLEDFGHLNAVANQQEQIRCPGYIDNVL